MPCPPWRYSQNPQKCDDFCCFFARTATAVTPVKVPVVCAVATGLLRGHIWEGKVLHNNEGAGRCRVWRARATSVLLVAMSGRRRGWKRHGASPALCGQRPQIDQNALPNNQALQESISDFQARRRALTGRGLVPRTRRVREHKRAAPHRVAEMRELEYRLIVITIIIEKSSKPWRREMIMTARLPRVLT